MEWVGFYIAFAFVVGWQWSRKGRSFLGGLLISLILSPLLGFLVGLFLAPDRAAVESAALSGGDLRKCPQCAELIKTEAQVCRYCGHRLAA